jgi:hypothetical protein
MRTPVTIQPAITSMRFLLQQPAGIRVGRQINVPTNLIKNVAEMYQICASHVVDDFLKI